MTNSNELAGERALITGGSKGIGKAIAQELSAAAADVILAASNQDRLEKAQTDILPTAQGKVSYFAADLRELKGCEDLADWVLRGDKEQQAKQPLSILINAAGATRGGDFLRLDDELWQDGFALKFYACARLCRLLWQELAAHKGKIVNIVGGFARTPDPDFMIGGAVNAAMANFSKALAGRGIRDGVRVNAVYPGTTETERLHTILADKAKASGTTIAAVKESIYTAEKIRRIGKAEDVAHLVRFLVSPQAEHIQGTAMAVDGGSTRGLF